MLKKLLWSDKIVNLRRFSGFLLLSFISVGVNFTFIFYCILLCSGFGFVWICCCLQDLSAVDEGDEEDGEGGEGEGRGGGGGGGGDTSKCDLCHERVVAIDWITGSHR